MKKKLTESQLKLFRTMCFGYFLDMKDVKLQPQVLHCLLLREVSQSKFDKIWFNIFGVRLKFSIGEFAFITGLKCIDDFERNKIGKYVKNNLLTKFFLWFFKSEDE